jgi:hypothetical protein
MVGYIELMVNNGVWHVATRVAMDIIENEKKYGEIIVKAILEQKEEYVEVKSKRKRKEPQLIVVKVWEVELSAKYRGFDGFYENAEHEILFTYKDQQQPDYNRMTELLRTMIRMAYNANARAPLKKFIR